MTLFAKPLMHAARTTGIASFVILLGSLSASADTEAHRALAAEIAELLTFKSETTAVTLSQCTLQIEAVAASDCTRPTDIQKSITTVDFGEVVSTEVRPYQDIFLMEFDLDVPTPSIFFTMQNRLTMDEDAAFDAYQEESQRLMDETTLVSGKSGVACSGAISHSKSRSITLFFDAQPTMVDNLTSIIAECRP